MRSYGEPGDGGGEFLLCSLTLTGDGDCGTIFLGVCWNFWISSAGIEKKNSLTTKTGRVYSCVVTYVHHRRSQTCPVTRAVLACRCSPCSGRRNANAYLAAPLPVPTLRFVPVPRLCKLLVPVSRSSTVLVWRKTFLLANKLSGRELRRSYVRFSSCDL